MDEMGLAPSPKWGKGKLGLAMDPVRPAELVEEAGGRMEMTIGSGHDAPTPVGRRGVGKGGIAYCRVMWVRGKGASHRDMPIVTCHAHRAFVALSGPRRVRATPRLRSSEGESQGEGASRAYTGLWEICQVHCSHRGLEQLGQALSISLLRCPVAQLQHRHFQTVIVVGAVVCPPFVA